MTFLWHSCYYLDRIGSLGGDFGGCGCGCSFVASSPSSCSGCVTSSSCGWRWYPVFRSIQLGLKDSQQHRNDKSTIHNTLKQTKYPRGPAVQGTPSQNGKSVFVTDCNNDDNVYGVESPPAVMVALLNVENCRHVVVVSTAAVCWCRRCYCCRLLKRALLTIPRTNEVVHIRERPP